MTSPSLDDLVSARTVAPALVDAVRLLHEIARMDPDAAPLASLAMVLTLRAGEDGHSCLDLSDIDSFLPERATSRVDPAALRAQLVGVTALVDASGADESRPGVPFVLDDDRLYIARARAEERAVAAALLRDGASHLSVVLGGPGMGKTTRIAANLVRRFSAAPDVAVSVALVAPTGKAARRMREALENAFVTPPRDFPPFTDELRERILVATTPRTVHKLLGYSPRRTPHFSRRPGRPLDEDIVIVDEASMMSLSLMHHLLAAMREDAELWLVGDPDQLASVDAGTVLGDIAAARATSPIIARRTDVLTAQHRFKEDSRINRLVTAVRGLGTGGPVDDVLALLEDSGPDFEWIEPVENVARLDAVTAEMIAIANRAAGAAAGGDFAGALAIHGEAQFLCAHRRGLLGVEGVNRVVRAGLVGEKGGEFYPGRPVMVTRNDDVLGLANGDVGIVCIDGDRRVVAFPGPDGPRVIPVVRLSGLETVHALTVHKSQGSEYDHAIVVLPRGDSRILTRELFYTGISRPKKRLTVVATREAVATALGRPVRRATGLRSLL